MELIRRLLQIAYITYWAQERQEPRSFYSGPVRRGAADKTTRPGMSSKDGELKGGSSEPVAEEASGSKTQPDAGEENRIKIATITSDDDQGRLRGVRGGFFPSSFPFTWKTLVYHTPSHSYPPQVVQHRRPWLATVRGRRGGSCIAITRGSIGGL